VEAEIPADQNGYSRESYSVENLSPANYSSQNYTAEDIDSLGGLEAVRCRPAMYIGDSSSAGLHHLVWEVVDNSVDEAMLGECDKIDVTIHNDGSCQVVDNGRGIPVDMHESGRPAAEVVFTELHAGGKFTSGAYTTSGGLHGVGITVVNALSTRVEVEIRRDQKLYKLSFTDGGSHLERPLEEVGPIESSLDEHPDSPAAAPTGTSIRFWPDAAIFEDTEFKALTIKERLRIMSFLNSGLRIRFRDLRSNSAANGVFDPKWTVFHNENGIVDLVQQLNKSKEPLFPEIGVFREQGQNEQGENRELEIAFQWNTGSYSDGIHSYANCIDTNEGGTHEKGFKASLTKTINRYAKDHNKLKGKDLNLSRDDIQEGLTAIISVRLGNPQFEGQTKRKLGNSDITSFVEKATNKYFRRWLEENPSPANRIIEKTLLARKARLAAEKARESVRQKSNLGGPGLPGKLADCSSKDPRERELYLVEGDSAGGSAKQARNPQKMAILALRGKILNVERAPVEQMYKNEEITAIISAIGAGFGTEFNHEDVRYHKIVLLCDADVDGKHISILLLTFFYRQMRDLVEQGHVYMAQPPLYSTMVGREKVYLKDDAAKDEFVEARPKHKNDFQRLKGLGEMDAEELWDTTLDPETRTLLQITVAEAAFADEIFSQLMGDAVEDRKKFIQENAGDVRFLDI